MCRVAHLGYDTEITSYKKIMNPLHEKGMETNFV